MLVVVGVLCIATAVAEPAPEQSTPLQSEKHVHNYGSFDKSYTRWTDRCRTCSRGAAGELHCSNIGIACTPTDIECVERESDAEKK